MSGKTKCCGAIGGGWRYCPYCGCVVVPKKPKPKGIIPPRGVCRKCGKKAINAKSTWCVKHEPASNRYQREPYGPKERV